MNKKPSYIADISAKKIAGQELGNLLDEQQVAAILNIKVKTLQSWRVTGSELRFVKIGRSVRYRRQDIEDFINSQTRFSTSEVINNFYNKKMETTNE